MQAVEFFAEDILHSEKNNITHAKGYILAALARSHKGSYGEFAHTSQIYLKDANFSGYSAKFIAFQLFERGVLSFIPSMLLKMITDDEYSKLPIKQQTELINIIDMSPNNVENLVAASNQSLQNAGSIVNEITNSFNNDSELKDTIKHILQMIAFGSAVSKQDECLCLMTAMGVGCKNPLAEQCIGCKYEISTKSTIYLLMSEFNRILCLKQVASSDQLKNKYTTLLKQVVLPSIAEIVMCINESYGEDAAAELEIIIQEMQNAN